MSDLIRRDDVFEALGITDKSTKYGGDHSGYNTLMLYEIKGEIDSIPTAEPKVGKWERKPYKRQGHEEVVIEGYSWRCSNCGDARKRNEPGMKFCPNCGAKMERSE